MTFPIYGKIRNVPNHQPAKVSKYSSPPQSPQFILMQEVFVFSSIGFHTGHKACHPLKKCCETAEPTPRNLRLVWQKKPEQSSRSLSDNTTFHPPSGLKCLKSESVKWNLATHLGSHVASSSLSVLIHEGLHKIRELGDALQGQPVVQRGPAAPNGTVPCQGVELVFLGLVQELLLQCLVTAVDGEGHVPQKLGMLGRKPLWQTTYFFRKILKAHMIISYYDIMRILWILYSVLDISEKGSTRVAKNVFNPKIHARSGGFLYGAVVEAIGPINGAIQQTALFVRLLGPIGDTTQLLGVLQVLAHDVHGEAGGGVVHGSIVSGGLPATIGGANLHLLAAVRKVRPHKSHGHASRAQVLLNAGIDEGMFADLNGFGTKIRWHISHQGDTAHIRCVAKLHSVHRLISAVVHIGCFWIQLPWNCWQGFHMSVERMMIVKSCKVPSTPSTTKNVFRHVHWWIYSEINIWLVCRGRMWSI